MREATLDFEIPSNDKLFRHLLSPEVWFLLSVDLRSALRPTESYDIRLSDKGRYLSGILSLSDTLRETFYLFEHPFWRSLVQKLSRREPSKQLCEKLASDVQTFVKGGIPLDKAAIESWLANELILAARQISKGTVWANFDEIEALYSSFLEGLQEEERQLLSRTTLRKDISELTRGNLLFQGAELRCPNCISSYWYSIGEINKVMSCRGCQTSFPLPAETRWSYQLNELVRTGVGDQGLSPVIRTLARLFDGARDCFFFIPSVEFLTYADNANPRAERELDIAWIKDGLFGVAEVKTSTQKFKRSNYEGLAALACEVNADIVLISAPEGNTDDLSRGKSLMQREFGATADIWTWGPDEFKRSPHWTRI